MNFKKIALTAFVVIPFVICLGLAAFVATKFYAKYDGPTTTFQIRPGEGFSSVNYKLDVEEMISSPRLFHYYAKLTNKMTALKAGTYEISNGSTMGDILTTLTEGTPILTRITIPEGKNMYEIGKILEEKGITTYKEFIRVCKSLELKKALGINAPSLEGYLFPETYKFAPKTPAKLVAINMVRLFNQKTKHLQMRQGSLTPHQIVILASIVEKETGAKWERPLIAGVYLNRLKKGMRLQADPTTIYGIWESYNGNLRRRHLLEKTPYNTYKISGLPLGPIASPSLAAIKAVINPDKHNNLFFVSKNDGTHIFTPTYKEHLKAVDKWQRTRSNRSGKSWRDLKQ